MTLVAIVDPAGRNSSDGKKLSGKEIHQRWSVSTCRSLHFSHFALFASL
jgi:hypothetical protein